MSGRLFAGIAGAFVALLVAAPLLAYTIILKDGSQIIAKKHRIEDERVIITLQNGTETFIALDQVDLERTEEYNANNVDGALVIDGGEVRGMAKNEPAPRKTLGDLILTGEAKTRAREPVRRPRSATRTAPKQSESGFIDLNSLQRRAYSDLEIMSDLRSYFTSQGLEAQVFAGTEGSRPMIEVITSSEAAVFKSLEVAAQALPQMRDRHAGRISALELLLRTSSDNAAGQFVMTPDLAESLNSGETEVAAFFVRYVQF